jgi:hypothetical protein
MSSKDIFQLPKSNPKLVSVLSRLYSHAAVSEEVKAKLARRYTQLASETSTDSESLAPASTFTAAQLSRAAAQAVRLSIQQGQLKDAYYVVTSLQASWDPPGEGDLPKHRFRYPKFEPISFYRRVSPRLATHALIHGLMRVGLSVKASQCAEYLMRDGFNIRSTTLQATIRNLVPTPSPGGAVQANALDGSRSIDSADILTLRSSMVSDRCTRCAVRLLIQAKKYRQRRTQDMFDFLIHICLLQGELIVGSLLFAMLVKIMHVQMAFSAQMKMESQAATAETSVIAEQKQAFRRRFNLHRDECLVHPDASLFPRKSLLHAILEAIESNLSQNPQDEEAAQAFCATLQALANIAMLLDQGRLPQADVSHLIHALYICPKVKNEVWIRRNGVPVRIVAYYYFHRVLKRLITTLPPQPLTRIIENSPLLRPLNITSCNSLLHYSLRHRLSPALGSKVLQYMTTGRRPPLEPDTATYNILIRSGTLSRKMDMTEAALHAFRLRKENEDHGIMIEGPIRLTSQNRVPSVDIPEHDPTFRFSTTLSRLREETLRVPINTESSIPLHADSTTLSSYITHLTSTGQASIVATILFYVLPELVVVDHPSWGSMTPEQRMQIRQDSRRACLQRAVMYGPFFFSSVLNALRKAGKTGLAERVWLLAKQAERASWIDGFSPGGRPWCLPVEAYTTMLQCYAAEARNGLDMRQGNKNKRHARVLDDTHKWKPRTEHSRVRGWAQFILRRNQIKGQHDDSRLGLLLFLSMRAGAREIYNTLMHIQHLVKSQAIISHVQHPQPDARFFNAALELAARRPHMQARATRTKRPHWRRKLRFAHGCYAKSGTVSSHWNAFLQEIAEAMVRAGYSVPPGLRYMFVGRYMQGTSHFEHAKELERRPFTFPHAQSPTFRSHSLHTTKSRGLPVRGGRSPPLLV